MIVYSLDCREGLMKKNSLCVGLCQGQKNIKTKSQPNLDESCSKVTKHR